MRVGLQINISQMLEMLSASLYKGNVLEVATRELLQNSFDAVKNTRDPMIEVKFDQYSNVLTFKDNGCGMSPETVENVFLTIGGTLKDGLDFGERSGGFGVAKVQFFMCADNIYVNTHKNGVTTVLDCSNKELIGGIASISTFSESRDAGTEVRLTFPTSYKDVSGNVKTARYYSFSVGNVLEKPLLGYSNIKLMWGGKNVNTYKKEYVVRESLPWGDVDVYYRLNLDRKSTSHLEYSVHCAGLYQFWKQEYVGNMKGIDDVMINIRPKYAAGNQYYPFANSRDNFSAFVKKDMERIIEEITNLGKVLYTKSMIDSMSNIQILDYCPVGRRYVQVHGDHVSGKAPDVHLPSDMTLEEFIDAVCEYQKAVSQVSKRVEEDKNNNKKSHIRLINSDNITVDNFTMSKVASVIYDIIYDTRFVTLIMDKGEKIPTVAGVLLDKKVRGRYVKNGDICAVYLNPIASEWYNGNHFAETMTSALIHELGHCADGYSGHCDSFFEAESEIRNMFWHYGLYTEVYDKFLRIYMDHSKDLVIKD